jgi:hypothetical protein
MKLCLYPTNNPINNSITAATLSKNSNVYVIFPFSHLRYSVKSQQKFPSYGRVCNLTTETALAARTLEQRREWVLSSDIMFTKNCTKVCQMPSTILMAEVDSRDRNKPVFNRDPFLHSHKTSHRKFVLTTMYTNSFIA